jgi:selenide,water dikinase
MLSVVPYTRDLVFIGGGHAHALVLKAWGMKPLPGVRITVINPGPTAPYTGMLPGHVAGHYGRDELEIDLVRLCRHAGARLILDRAVDVDRVRREVVLAGRGPVAYDVASIDVGITAQMDLPGFAEHGVGAKPLDVYAAKWRAFLEQARAGKIAPEVAVIGGGVAGCELAMAMAFALRQAGVAPTVSVIEAGPQISGMGDRARARVLAAMAELGVQVHVGAHVARVEETIVVLESGAVVPAQICVGAAGAFPHDWVSQTDLPLNDGFVEVDPQLHVLGDEALFAVGDCAHMGFAPRPKAGVFAVRAAPVLYDNMRAVLTGGRLRPFKPQRDYLKLISLGGKSAMAEKFGMTIAGPILWRWKDRIDRSFMEKLSDFPVMTAPAVKGEVAAGVAGMLAEKPLCGGCGAKVGGDVLSGVLAQLDVSGTEVLTGPGDDAAVIRQPGGGFQVLSTDHLRSMVEDPVMMTRIAAVHALGDIWAMGAKPQVALTSLVLPQMSPELQARTLAEITAATREVMEEAGAQLVGGHTTMGAELTIGFTVTGTRDVMPITVAGAQVGDVLVLTRAIGSGVLLAADMQGRANGRDVAAMLDVMQQGQRAQAEILHGAHAMTDVTGFGLAGHAAAIARASGVDVVLWQDQIPVYAGARTLSEAGVASTLMPANRRNAPVEGIDDPLLFDPQTAGGLLAALPKKAAENAVQALNAAGLTGVIIGEVLQGTGHVTLK